MLYMGQDVYPETSGIQASLLTIRPRVSLLYYSEACPKLPSLKSLKL